MKFKQFFGGMLVGIAFGMLIGVCLEKGLDADTSKYAGVGIILTIIGVVTARR